MPENRQDIWYKSKRNNSCRN